eukprot:2282669-Rhodomonas_salina.1
MAQHPLICTRSSEAWWHSHPAIEANCLDEREPCTEVKLLLLTRPWLDRQLIPLLSGLQGLESIARSPARAVHPGRLHRLRLCEEARLGAEGLWAGIFSRPPGDK